MDLEDKFIIVKQLSYGIFRARSKKDNRQMAIRQITLANMTDKEKKRLIQEVNTLMEIRSSNIVRYQSFFINKPKMSIYIITEYCSGGNLQQFLNMNRDKGLSIEEKAIWKIFSEVVTAVDEIHNDKKGVILHRDIRPSNIFLDKSNNVKLGNFNLIKRLSPEEQFALTTLSNNYYKSPEQICEGKFTQKSDIWALGCLLYEIATLKNPFQRGSQFLNCRMIKEENPEPLPSGYSKQLNRVIKWCLYKQPEKRPSVSSLISIPEVNYRIRNRKITENKRIYEEKEKKIYDKEIRIKQLEWELKELEAELLYEKENVSELMNQPLNSL